MFVPFVTRILSAAALVATMSTSAMATIDVSEDPIPGGSTFTITNVEGLDIFAIAIGVSGSLTAFTEIPGWTATTIDSQEIWESFMPNNDNRSWASIFGFDFDHFGTDTVLGYDTPQDGDGSNPIIEGETQGGYDGIGAGGSEVCVSDGENVQCVEVSITAVPEPASLALAGFVLIGLAAIRRRISL